MSDLISRTDILKKAFTYEICGRQLPKTIFVTDIINADTVNAIKVVRCKECEWFDRTEKFNCKYMNHFVEDNDYCSFAEAKKGIRWTW